MNQAIQAVVGMVSGIIGAIGQNRYANDPTVIEHPDVYITETQVSPQPYVMAAGTLFFLVIVILIYSRAK
jgi:hypothetical protein